MNKTLDMIKGEYKIMDQKVLAVVGGHEITDKEVDAFIKSLPREQQAYASNPQFRAQCQEQLEALYSFAKYGEDLKLDETEEYKSVMENARKDILARLAMKQLFDSAKVTRKSKIIMKQISLSSKKRRLFTQSISLQIPRKNVIRFWNLL